MSNQASHHLSDALQRDLFERCHGWLECITEGWVVLDPLFTVRIVTRPLPPFGNAPLPNFSANLWPMLCPPSRIPQSGNSAHKLRLRLVCVKRTCGWAGVVIICAPIPCPTACW